MKIASKAGIILVTVALTVGTMGCAAKNTDTLQENNKQENTVNIPSQDTNNNQENTAVPDTVISGIVRYNELESGFYELDGYRLVGDQDFSKYKGKYTVVIGELDDSESIYMVKAIKIEDIIAKDDTHFVDRMETLIYQYRNALDNAKNNDEGVEITERIKENLDILQQILLQNIGDGSLLDSVTILEGSGKYVGQADSNFIEIEIENDTGRKEYRTFQLSDELKEKFQELGLVSGDLIEFNYYEREKENPFITGIQKI